MKNLLVILAAAIVVALPFIFRRPAPTGDWRSGDPVLVVITPHNEALRDEFGRAFSRWHREHYGRPVKVDWRVIGGTTEIMRYLASEYVSSCQAWRRREGREWPSDGGDVILNRSLPLTMERAAHQAACELYETFRGSDDPAAVSCGIDLFFGGGTYDHGKAERQGLTVPPWRGADRQRPEVVALLDAFPTQLGGETWRSECYFGNVLSTFGICYNRDRLADLGIAPPPAAWGDLADPRLFGEVGLSDPTKSGSVAKAFEMVVHQQCAKAVASAGFSDDQVVEYEAAMAKARLPPGQVPTNVPAAYQAAVERGWADGINLLRLIGANARYFTDGAGKVPVDVSAGFVAAGVAIDFYGHFQAETERAPDGAERMIYVTPVGGTSVSADPISLLRGAPHREQAVRFIEFVLGPDGQKLWNFRPGSPGGPARFALRRLPIRRDFYPFTSKTAAAAFASNRVYEIDDFTNPAVNPYEIAARFSYRPRWTVQHFGIQRDIVRAMCMDAGDELRLAWRAILAHGGPAANPRAMALLTALPDKPVPLDWRSAIGAYAKADRLDYMRQWNAFFRARYREAREAAEASR